MEAKELMIGDLVCVWSDDGDEQIQWKAEDFVEVNPQYCDGIVLTEEILLANGFNDEWGVFWFPNLLPYGVVFKGDDTIGVRSTTNEAVYFVLHYVHELQHALRLCGLNELADNFKLK